LRRVLTASPYPRRGSAVSEGCEQRRYQVGFIGAGGLSSRMLRENAIFFWQTAASFHRLHRRISMRIGHSVFVQVSRLYPSRHLLEPVLAMSLPARLLPSACGQSRLP